MISFPTPRDECIAHASAVCFVSSPWSLRGQYTSIHNDNQLVSYLSTACFYCAFVIKKNQNKLRDTEHTIIMESFYNAFIRIIFQQIATLCTSNTEFPPKWHVNALRAIYIVRLITVGHSEFRCTFIVALMHWSLKVNYLVTVWVCIMADDVACARNFGVNVNITRKSMDFDCNALCIRVLDD